MKTLFILVTLLSSLAFANDKKMDKVPKSVFLIKKAKITSEVGEPQYYPAEAQLRTISHDKVMHNTKKFE